MKNKIMKVTSLMMVLALAGLLLAACGQSKEAQQPSPSNSQQAAAPQQDQTAAEDKDKSAVLGYVPWDEDVAVTYLWKKLLEEKGYKIELKQLDIGPLYQALSQGAVDVHFDVWMPLTNKNYMDKYSSYYTTLGKWYLSETKMGFVVPKYMEHINTIEDLKTYADEFKGQAIGVEPGSETTQFAKIALEGYGVDNMKVVDSSTTAMLSALDQAYNAQEPIVVTLWSPHWAFGKYELKYLEDPQEIMGQPGWIQTEAHKEWAETHPVASKWIGNMKLDELQLAELEIEINNAKDPATGVDNWLKIEKNRQMADSWVQ